MTYFFDIVFSWATFFTSFFDNFLVTLIVTVLIGAFIFWCTPAIVSKSKMDVIEASDINPTLKSALTSTKLWIYKGTCGRYTRATTIPKLAESARNASLGRDIKIYLMNPKNDELCSEYSIYRRSLKSSDKKNPWTKEIVQEEIIATVVVALKYRYSEPLLRIDVFFLEYFSAFRLDISDNFVVVTKEDKAASALKADAETYFYDSYKDDIRLTERQSKNLKHFNELIFDETINEKKLKQILDTTRLFEFSKLSPKSIENILEKINNPQDPY
ncbi:hypothetical protein [Acinetobacter rudis]|uniref:hypothetical protein n=1 Tax=Acinetobacter rudis TaxID=632955 RepID=UPI003340F8D2